MRYSKLWPDLRYGAARLHFGRILQALYSFPMNLTDFQLSILERAAQTRGAGGFSAKSCRRHIERAWMLKESMPEVAVFLAITAEEEAATALFHAFQKKRYKNIGRINKRNHMHKAGV